MSSFINIKNIDIQKTKPKIEKILIPLKNKLQEIGILKISLVIENSVSFDSFNLSISLFGYINGELVAEFTVTISEDKETNIINAYIDKIELDKKIQRQGLSTIAFSVFETIFTICKVDNITITGIDDGRFVWAKKTFNMNFVEPEAMRKDFYKWLKKHKKPYKYIGLKPYMYPKAFLLSKSNIQYIRNYKK